MNQVNKPTAAPKRSFFRFVLNGMALPGEVITRHQFRRLPGSDLERIRGDVVAVGNTFSTVIAREHGNQKAPTGPTTKRTAF